HQRDAEVEVRRGCSGAGIDRAPEAADGVGDAAPLEGGPALAQPFTDQVRLCWHDSHCFSTRRPVVPCGAPAPSPSVEDALPLLVGLQDRENRDADQAEHERAGHRCLSPFREPPNGWVVTPRPRPGTDESSPAETPGSRAPPSRGGRGPGARSARSPVAPPPRPRGY